MFVWLLKILCQIRQVLRISQFGSNRTPGKVSRLSISTRHLIIEYSKKGLSAKLEGVRCYQTGNNFARRHFCLQTVYL
jgi:hypothetical protein